jgi:predicted DNA-binding ribbon-helix-helix protein
MICARRAARPGGRDLGGMKSTVIKRSVVINGHKTSVSVEDHFWAALKEIAAAV